jgi:hypothetical protein
MPTTQFTSVNTGSDANAGDGSTIRAAFTIINENTTKLNNQLNGTLTQSTTYPVTYISASNDISANSGTVYGQTVRGGVVYSRGSEVLTSSSGTWNGGTVNLYGIFANSDASTSTTTGALQVVGGLGVGGNIFVGGLVSIAGNLTAGNLNISSGLTVASLTVATTAGFIGNLTAANLTATGTVNASGNVNISGNLTVANASISNLYGNIRTGTQSGITALGTLTGLTVSGNAVVNSTLYGRGIYDNGQQVVSISSGAGNLTISGNSISLPATGPGAGTYGSASVVPIITTDAYGRIVSIGSGSIAAPTNTITLAGTGGSGSVTGGGTLTFASGNGVGITISSSTATINTAQDIQTTASPTFAGITLPGISKNGTTGTGNIGSSANGFNTVFAKATTAQYADLAEKYESDADYEPGTVLVFGTDTEVTISTRHEDNRVAGVVTTNPAYLMNSEAAGVAVALQGRVPCRVVGTIRRGDMMVTSDVAGVATSCMPPFGPHIGTVIGKALQNYDSDQVGVIEIVVGRV